MCSPPGTSPTPMCPALSRRMTMLRVKNGACAPERLSNMPSCPATGTTSISVTLGEEEYGRSVIAISLRFTLSYRVHFAMWTEPVFLHGHVFCYIARQQLCREIKKYESAGLYRTECPVVPRRAGADARQ